MIHKHRRKYIQTPKLFKNHSPNVVTEEEGREDVHCQCLCLPEDITCCSSCWEVQRINDCAFPVITNDTNVISPVLTKRFTPEITHPSPIIGESFPEDNSPTLTCTVSSSPIIGNYSFRKRARQSSPEDRAASTIQPNSPDLFSQNSPFNNIISDVNSDQSESPPKISQTNTQLSEKCAAIEIVSSEDEIKSSNHVPEKSFAFNTPKRDLLESPFKISQINTQISEKCAAIEVISNSEHESNQPSSVSSENNYLISFETVSSANPSITNNKLTYKRKRYKKNGLARKLQNCISYKNSSIAMWLHEQQFSRYSTESCTTTLLLQISDFWEEYNNFVIRCINKENDNSCIVLVSINNVNSFKPYKNAKFCLYQPYKTKLIKYNSELLKCFCNISRIKMCDKED